MELPPEVLLLVMVEGTGGNDTLSGLVVEVGGGFWMDLLSVVGVVVGAEVEAEGSDDVVASC